MVVLCALLIAFGTIMPGHMIAESLRSKDRYIILSGLISAISIFGGSYATAYALITYP